MFLLLFFFKVDFSGSKNEKKTHDFLWLAGFLSWKVVGGVVGAASGQVGFAPFFAVRDGGCGFYPGKVGHVFLKIWA